ncbi:hypothetical protein [Chromobacterium haemolyticum]|uniref:hypothetical protein n=1 Tax=Chromobacterium haemolyticum TaxID=394935 RepID=UPI0013181B95|nr:hypothetical protein [Chromobacterium haemolyticum]BBH12946.1 hypothetical protein CH06BL_21940 [Chromobacterium haemolyticum]
MSEQIQSPSTGKTLVKVATKQLTPTSDTKVKTITVPRVFIEVIISDSRAISAGSQWGHAAVVIDGTVYSRGHEEYVTMPKGVYLNGGTYNRALGPARMGGQGFRDNAGIVLWVSPREKKVVEDELKRRVQSDRAHIRKEGEGHSTYSIFDNSCSSNVADALELVGILAHDPRWLSFPVTPAELLAVLSKSNRFVKKNYYQKKDQ